MRMDKLTTKFQEALGDAQSLALAKDHAYIDPAHVLLAMLHQQDGPKALLQRAGVNMTALMSAASAAVERLPQVTGQDQVQVGPELVKLLQAAEKESLKRGDAFVASELFLLALADIPLRRLGISIKPLRFLSHFLRMNWALVLGFVDSLGNNKKVSWDNQKR